MRFENKVVLITGGTRGIGFATVRLFASERARVMIVGRKEDLAISHSVRAASPLGRDGLWWVSVSATSIIIVM